MNNLEKDRPLNLMYESKMCKFYMSWVHFDELKFITREIFLIGSLISLFFYYFLLAKVTVNFYYYYFLYIYITKLSKHSRVYRLSIGLQFTEGKPLCSQGIRQNCN